jgi:hypothetical protein
MLSKPGQKFRECRGRLPTAHSQPNKTLVGGQIILHPTEQGHLEAELSEDYAKFLKLPGGKSKILVVAWA